MMLSGSTLLRSALRPAAAAARNAGASSSSRTARLASTVVPRAEAGDGKTPVVGKAVLAKRLAEDRGLSLKAAGEIVDSLLDDIMLSVAEGSAVTIPGFGSFKRRSRAARKGRNPKTGAELDIPAKEAPAFTAGAVFKGVVQAGSWEKYDEMVAASKAAKAKK